ncbi:hypothetical protein D3C80_1440550 [compost metagenome]
MQFENNEKIQAQRSTRNEATHTELLQPGLALAFLCRAVRRAVHGDAGPDRHHLPVQAATRPTDVRQPDECAGRPSQPQRRHAAQPCAIGLSTRPGHPVPAADQRRTQRAIRREKRWQRTERVRRPVSGRRPGRAGREEQPASHRPGHSWRADDRHRRRSIDRDGGGLGHRAGSVRRLPVVATRQGWRRNSVATVEQQRPRALA